MLVASVVVVTLAAVGAGLWFSPKTYTSSATLTATSSPDAVASGENLDSLRGSYQGGITDFGGHVFLENLLAFLDQPFHTIALMTARFELHGLEDRLQSGDVFLGLLQVLLEACLQVVVGSGFGHLGQGFE